MAVVSGTKGLIAGLIFVAIESMWCDHKCLSMKTPRDFVTLTRLIGCKKRKDISLIFARVWSDPINVYSVFETFKHNL